MILGPQENKKEISASKKKSGELESISEKTDIGIKSSNSDSEIVRGRRIELQPQKVVKEVT
jgi:hypothetical protein